MRTYFYIGETQITSAKEMSFIPRQGEKVDVILDDKGLHPFLVEELRWFPDYNEVQIHLKSR